MTVPKLLFAALLVCCSMSLFAQVGKEKMRERIKEVFDEKLRKKNVPFRVGENVSKSSSASQRISNVSNQYEEAETTIAVNPIDSTKLVASFIETYNGVYNNVIYYSSYEGNTWQKSNLSSYSQAMIDYPGGEYFTGCDATLAWDKNGRVYVSWITIVKNAAQDSMFYLVYWAWSDNNGQNWSLAQGYNKYIGMGLEGQNWKDNFCDRQWLAVDNSNGPNQGTVYCSFVNFNDVNQFSGIKYKTPGMDSFSAVIPVYVGTTQFNNVEVDAAGVLHLTFTDLDLSKIVHISTADFGQNFSLPVHVGNCMYTGSGILHSRDNPATNLAIDGGGNLHVVWTDYDIMNVSSYYAFSTNGGQTWSTPLSLNGFLTSITTIMPVVAARGNFVSIAFYGAYNQTDWDYYHIVSTNGGQSFTAPIKISDGPTTQQWQNSYFFGDYNRSVSSMTHTYSIWCDGPYNIGPKAYFARTPHDQLDIRELTVIKSDIKLRTIYPNPAKDHVQLKISSPSQYELDVLLTDISGKAIAAQKMKVETGENQLTFPLSKVAPGIYALHISSGGSLLYKRKIIVQQK